MYYLRRPKTQKTMENKEKTEKVTVFLYLCRLFVFGQYFICYILKILRRKLVLTR